MMLSGWGRYPRRDCARLVLRDVAAAARSHEWGRAATLSRW